MIFLRTIAIKDIHKIATNKNLYICLCLMSFRYNLSRNKIQEFTDKRYKINRGRIATINQTIDSCKNELRRQIISKYTTNILQLCADKCIDMNFSFQIIIKELVDSSEITDTNIATILEKIVTYLQAIADENPHANISVLTNFICTAHGKTNMKLLLSICQIKDAQLQDIASQQYYKRIENKFFFKGFSESLLINAKEKKKFNQNTYKFIKSMQAAVVKSQVQPCVMVLDATTIVKADAAFNVATSKPKDSYIDLNDDKKIPVFFDGERKSLESSKSYATNNTNNIEVKKRKAGKQYANQVKKAKRLDKIINKIAANIKYKTS